MAGTNFSKGSLKVAQVLYFLKRIIINFGLLIIADIVCLSFVFLFGGNIDLNALLYGITWMILLIITYFGWCNTAFLLFLYFTKISKGCFNNNYLGFAEGVLFFGIYGIVSKIIDLVSNRYKYCHYEGNGISNDGVSKFCSGEAHLLYTFVLLLFVILFVKFLFRKNQCINRLING